jgi:hypothetical protein
VKDAATVSKTQQDEKLEALAAENRKLVDRAVRAEASNKRLAAQHGVMVERIADLEANLDASPVLPEHVQRTFEHVQRRVADLEAENEALKRESEELRLEIGACHETAKELKAALRGDGPKPAVTTTVDDIARIIAQYPDDWAGWPYKISPEFLNLYRRLALRVAVALGVDLVRTAEFTEEVSPISEVEATARSIANNIQRSQEAVMASVLEAHAPTLPAPAQPEVSAGPLEALKGAIRLLARALLNARDGQYGIRVVDQTDAAALEALRRGEVSGG